MTVDRNPEERGSIGRSIAIVGAALVAAVAVLVALLILIG